MLVAVTCPSCHHRGYVAEDILRRSLRCSHCGGRNRFVRGSPLRDEGVIAKASHAAKLCKHPPRPSFVEQSLLPDDLVQLLWNDQKPSQNEDGFPRAV
jgi:PHP family Zn ribbon phosphoesterase